MPIIPREASRIGLTMNNQREYREVQAIERSAQHDYAEQSRRMQEKLRDGQAL